MMMMMMQARLSLSLPPNAHLLTAHNCHLEPSILLTQDGVELIDCIVHLRLVGARAGSPERRQIHHIVTCMPEAGNASLQDKISISS